MATADPLFSEPPILPDRAAMELAADQALVTPILNTSPLPQYDYDKLDYAMTIGIERTPKGRIWACWVSGGDNDNAYFVLSTSDDEGETWSKPRLVIDPHDKKLPYKRRALVGNLWTDPSGKLWLFFDQAMTYFDGRAGLWATTCENPDSESPTWSEPRRIWHGCALNKPIVLSNGDWLMEVTLWQRYSISKYLKEAFPDLDQFRMANFLASSDQGKTWERRGGVSIPSGQFDETCLVERKDGSIWATTRTGAKFICETTSSDGGRTWSTPQKTSISSISSRHFIRRLKSGNLLLIKHGTTIEELTPKRSHLSAFISGDDGRTWKGGLLLDEREKISYPDGFQSPDGTIFISYDHDRDLQGEIFMARFTEEDVLAGSFKSAKAKSKILVSKAISEKIAKRREKAVAEQAAKAEAEKAAENK